MKKTFVLLLFLIASCLMSYAQFTSKGNTLLGGASDFEMRSSTSEYKFPGSSTVAQGRTTSFSLIPQAGYFLWDNITLGAGLTFSSFSFKPDDGGNKTKSTSFLFSPFGRYYFNRFYGQASFDLGITNTEFSDSSTAESNITGWSLLGGYAVKLNETVTFEPQVGYASSTSKDNGDVKRFNSGLFIRAGIYIYLPKK